MIASLAELLSAVFDALLPPHEDVRRARTLSAKELAALLDPHHAGTPAQTGKKWIVAFFPYRNPRIRALIRAVKYHGETKALSPVAAVLGEYLLETLAEKKLLSGWEQPLLIPMPASPKRLRERGYNQAERIAAGALPALGNAVEFSPRALAREERASQVSLDRSRRSENIRNAFYVPDASLVSGKSIILVDDVVESGSTFTDARRALRAAGARDIIGVALAH